MIRTTVVGILVLTSVGGVGAFFAVEEIQLLDVRVIAMDDPSRSDRITDLWVEVYNPGPRTLHPNFVVPSGALRNWYAWEISDGPVPLEPGANATYHVTQPPFTGIPINEGFRVIVHDISIPRVRGASEITMPNITWRLPAVLNPTFEAWIPSMFHYSDLPYAWVHWHELFLEDKYAIWGEPGAASLRLELDQNRTNGTEWTHVSLRQRIDFPERIRIDFVNGTRGAFSAGARSQVGVSLDDVHGRTQVMILFTNHPTDADQDARVNLTFGDYAAHRILVTNRTIELDMVALYRELGWHIPAVNTVPRLLPHGPGDVGMGAASVLAGAEKMEIQRPVELKVFLASYPPHEREDLFATFSYVGGSAYEPAPSRLE